MGLGRVSNKNISHGSRCLLSLDLFHIPYVLNSVDAVFHSAFNKRYFLPSLYCLIILPCDFAFISYTRLREVAQLCPTLRPHGLYSTRLFCPWNFPGKSTGVGCHFLLQGTFPDPGIEPKSPALRADALPSEPPGKSTEKLHGKPSLSLCFQLLPHLVM